MTLSKSVVLFLIAGMIPLTACKQGAVNYANGAETKPRVGALPETTNSSSSLVAWETVGTVSPKRKIEVGDHPGIVLEKYEVGGRAQRVRFHLADDRATRSLVSRSPQDLLFQSDSKVAKAENDKWSMLGLVIEPPVNIGLAVSAC